MDLFVVPGDTLVEPDRDYDAYFLAETRGLCEHFAYHKHKIVFYLSSMRRFARDLRDQGDRVIYKSLRETGSKSYQEVLEDTVSDESVDSLTTYAPKDRFFNAVSDVADTCDVNCSILDNPNFFLSAEQYKSYFADHSYFHQSFYKWQRERLDVLIDDGEPTGGSWSYDEDNRESLGDPSKVPSLPEVSHSPVVGDVKELVADEFADHPGRVDNFWLPTSEEAAKEWFETFLSERFEDFGPYQDAINEGVPFAFHSVISPMMNNGLLNPSYVVRRAETWYDEHDTHLPSVEGFIRQVIGWREFMRGVYETKDLRSNYFEHSRGLSDAWWTGDTGLKPVDDVVEQAKEYGYAHHIQRLMVVSNAMLLCEAHPDDVYQWFMEFFVDSADWVMEPNVYGMGQFADGGVFATKPYISSSNYVLKMSDYSEGSWCGDWDALYWTFLDNNRDKLSDNHRMGFMYSLLDKKGDEELAEMHDRASTVRDQLTSPR